ncbi:MAG: enoyl-CoA hydratase-related protein [Pseudomonadota bacterium]
MTDPYQHNRVDRRDRILVVTINRPEAYNALYGPVHAEMARAWDDFDQDDGLWVGVVTGAGDKAFCAGNDLKATAAGGDISIPPSGFGGLCDRYEREKPIIAAVNGVAMGGGMEIALACDLIVAAPHARFALPEVKVGLLAAAGGVQRLSRQIGRKKAMELILTGRALSAEEAERLGVINRVADGRDALTEALALAEEVLAASPGSVRASKRLLNRLEQAEGLPASIGESVDEVRALMGTEDSREGVAAFVEKRAPRWRNC